MTTDGNSAVLIGVGVLLLALDVPVVLFLGQANYGGISGSAARLITAILIVGMAAGFAAAGTALLTLGIRRRRRSPHDNF